MFTTTSNWSFTWASLIQSAPSHPLSLSYILLLCSHLCTVFPKRSLNYTAYKFDVILTMHRRYVEIKCQLDATEVFIADLVACSTCFGHHHAHHQELKSIIQWLLRVVFCAASLLNQHPANRTHNPQFHTRPATWKNHSTKYQML